MGDRSPAVLAAEAHRRAMSAWSELAACGYTIRAAVIVDDKARATATRELAHALLDGMLDAYVEVGHYHRATP